MAFPPQLAATVRMGLKLIIIRPQQVSEVITDFQGEVAEEVPSTIKIVCKPFMDSRSRPEGASSWETAWTLFSSRFLHQPQSHPNHNTFNNKIRWLEVIAVATTRPLIYLLSRWMGRQPRMEGSDRLTNGSNIILRAARCLTSILLNIKVSISQSRIIFLF